MLLLHVVAMKTVVFVVIVVVYLEEQNGEDLPKVGRLECAIPHFKFCGC